MKKYRTLTRSVLLMVICGLFVNFIPAHARETDTPHGNWIKVLVERDNASVQADLARQGGQLLVSYEAFDVWRMPQAQRQNVAANAQLAIRDDFDQLYLRDITLNTQLAARLQPVPLRQTDQTGTQLWLVQFVGPVKDTWLQELRKQGITPLIAMPTNGYLVQGDAGRLTRLSQQSVVQWTSAYEPWYRLSPALRPLALDPAKHDSKAGMIDVTVQLVTGESTQAELKQLLALGGKLHKQPAEILGFTNISLQVPVDQLASIAMWPAVYNIETWGRPEQLDEVQGQIIAGNLDTSGASVVPSSPGYLAWLDSLGFPQDPAAYPVIDVVDDGLDVGDADAVVHADFYQLGQTDQPDRVAYIGNCTADATGNAVGGHGHLNAGIVAGYNDQTTAPYQDSLGYNRGVGISPYGRVAGTKIFANTDGYDISECGNTDNGVVEASYQAGADITSNSWGCGPPFCTGNVYDSSSQAYDALTRDASGLTAGNQQMLHVFSAGNNSSSGLGTPGTAKNVLTVGATENVRDNGVEDGCNQPHADNADDLADFSSVGPTTDGRAKPDIVAPGTHIQSAASPDPGFNGSAVCGAENNDFEGNSGRYYPPSQTIYTWSSGTSHSAPAAAGAASLIHEYYGRVLRPGLTPSPAMIKALMLNTPRYLDGLDTGGTYPTSTQGWGDINLGNLFDGTPRKIYDQVHVFTDSGQQRQYVSSVGDPAKPVRVSLVWTDAPGSTTGNSYVNNLNLSVDVGGQVYRGNVFNGQWSIAGGTADPRNNVENIFLPAGTTGVMTVTLTAENIAGDALPGNGDLTDQDYALVIYNAGSVDPSLPDAQFATETQTVIEGTATASVNVQLTGTHSEPIQVNYATGGTALAGQDYVVPSGTLVIPAGATSAQITLVLSDDAIFEQAETIDIELIDSPTTEVITPLLHRITITENDPMPVMNWGIESREVLEQTALLRIPLELDRPSAVTTKATLTVTGTAELGKDYQLAEDVVTIVPGTTAVSVTVNLLDDQLDEFDELFVISLSDVEGAMTGVQSVTVLLNDDDEMPTAEIGEGGILTQTFSYNNTVGVAIPDNTPAGITTTLDVSGFGGGILDIDFRIDGSACSNAAGSTTVGIAHTWVGDLIMNLSAPDGTAIDLMRRPGPGSVGSSGNNFCQTMLDDQSGGDSIQTIANTDGPYTGSYTPAEPLNTFVGSPANGTWSLNISDNVRQDAGTLYGYSLLISGIAFSTTEVLTVSEDVGQVSLAITLDTPSGRTVRVPYTVLGTADSSDHTLQAGELIFQAGAAYQTLTFNILDTPTIEEPLETVIIQLQQPDYAGIAQFSRYEVRILGELEPTIDYRALLPFIRR